MSLGEKRLRLGVVACGAVVLLAGVACLTVLAEALPMVYSPWFYPFVGVSLVAMGVIGFAVVAFAETKTRAPLTRLFTLRTRQSPVEALRVMDAYIAEVAGTPTARADNVVSARFGSQLALRVMGVMTQYGVDRIPFSMRFEALRSGGETEVRLTFSSDEGWYLYRAKMSDRAFGARFAYVTAVLAARLGAEWPAPLQDRPGNESPESRRSDG